MMDIVIIGGFLGSGKTTVLNNLIEEAKSSKNTVAVIMNELGQQSVDTFLIDKNVAVNEILDGCICCQMKHNVTEQLHDLYIEHQPDIIFIECSGIAHPIEVLDACLTPVLAPFSRVISILGVLDANLYNNINKLPIDIQKLINSQIKYCSDIVFNKIDLVNPEQLLKSIHYFENSYPETNPFITTHGNVSLNNLKYINFNSANNIKRDEIYHKNINHVLYNCDFSWDKDLFITWLKHLPSTIYRVKGFLHFKEYTENCVIQYSNNHLDIETTSLNMEQYLVIIGHNMNHKEIIESIDNYKTKKL
ncbi:GTP-binding protein [Staphylococcus saprophyticus]